MRITRRHAGGGGGNASLLEGSLPLLWPCSVSAIHRLRAGYRSRRRKSSTNMPKKIPVKVIPIGGIETKR
jgi:hypothetical protein